MVFKVAQDLLPIKAHFFFFFAALGPLLPQINMFGRQLGVSPAAMGLVTAILPLLWAIAKPLFGYIVDYWPNHRKFVFMLLIATMTGSYCSFWFLPIPKNFSPTEPSILEYVYRLNDTIYLKEYDVNNDERTLEKYNCNWNCSVIGNFNIYLTNSSYINTIYVDGEVTNKSCIELYMELNDVREGQVICSAKEDCNLLCFENEINETKLSERTKREIRNYTKMSNNYKLVEAKGKLNSKDVNSKTVSKMENNITMDSKDVNRDNFYVTFTFWAFVLLMCVGTVAFNVANCIGDAVCFDVLGPERGSRYGSQRGWGTVGYGVTALLGGWLVDAFSGMYKDFTPAFIIALVATFIDLFSCRALNLPSLKSPEDSGKALREVLRIPRVVVFITFAVVAGTFDSFIIYYMFWFLEELAEQTGYYEKIKLIEGIVVAAESFGGELLFFFLSGKIIKRWGYGTTMTFCLFCYGIRLAFISVIENPWHLVFIEGIMQGPTYALCYSTIVGYAAHVAPEGYSATVQGIVAGMDDGLGFSVGSLLGGVMYSAIGGRLSFRLLSAVAITAAALHACLFTFVTRTDRGKLHRDSTDVQEEGEKMLPIMNNAIYQETVVPVGKEDAS